MSPELLTALSLMAMIFMIFLGIPIGVCLATTALAGTWMLFGSFDLMLFTAGNASFSILRNYVFATIPLFIIMGNLIARSGAAADLYTLTNRGLRRLPARLAIATVAGNAVFAAISGVSVAAAATFSQVAYPQMRRFNYHRPLALGVVAGSAMLGMLIPPSILLIFWGILTETSIGDLFLAGVVPGLLLALAFMVFLMIRALINPDLTPAISEGADEARPIGKDVLASGFGIIGLILLVIGGIWGGFFTPTEAAGIGAIGALVLALAKRLGPRDILTAIVDAGRTAAPIMFLLLTSAIYSQFLVTSGAIGVITSTIETAGFGPIGLVVAMTVVWLLLGMILDSTSIILLTVPIFAPLSAGFGYDPLVFAIYGILVIEAGLLTPPFGLLVYVVKGSVPEPVSLAEVFRGSAPYCLMILLVAMIVLAMPSLATWLPSTM